MNKLLHSIQKLYQGTIRFIWSHPLVVLAIILAPLAFQLKSFYAKADLSYLFSFLSQFWKILLADAPLYLILLLTLLLSFRFKNLFVWSGLRIVFLCLFTLYLLDIAIYELFASRLIFSDIAIFYDFAFDFVNNINKRLFVPATIIILLFYSLFFLSGRTIQHKKMFLYRVFLFIFLILSVVQLKAASKGGDGLVHRWKYSNTFAYNLDILTEHRRYSQKFIEQFVPDSLEESCQEVAQQKKNIILLTVESLSSYQSKLFTGLADLTPEMDRIAHESRWYSNFYSNGFLTEDGKISLIVGEHPILPPASFTRGGGGLAFSGFFNKPRALPHVASKEGYSFYYLEAANPEFSNLREWLRSNGVEHFFGNDDPAFDSLPRFVFQSVSDDHVLRFANELITNRVKKPFFLDVMTTTNHSPFVDPESGLISPDKTTLFTDRAIGEFYRTLKKEGFFENGLLIIVGDHRSKVPYVKGELERYGDRAAALIPLIVVDGTFKEQKIDQLFQQTDLHNGLVGMITGERCTSIWRGDPLADEPISPKYVVHRRGDDRTAYSIFSDNGDYRIKVDGDRTRIVSPAKVDSSVNALLLNYINGKRMGHSAADTVHLSRENSH